MLLSGIKILTPESVLLRTGRPSAFPSGEVAALGLSSPMDGVPTLRQVCVSADVAKVLLNRLISHSASNFQAVFVNRSLWQANCFPSGR